MKVIANQAQSGGVASLSDIQNRQEPIKGSDLEEKFLDLLAQLFQGANLHNPRSVLDQNLPAVKAAEVVTRKIEEKVQAQEKKASPEPVSAPVTGQERGPSESVSAKHSPKKNNSGKADSDSSSPEVAPEKSDGQVVAAPEAQADGEVTKKPVEKCGNSLIHRMQSEAQSAASGKDGVEQPMISAEQVAAPTEPTNAPVEAQAEVPTAEIAGAEPAVAEAAPAQEAGLGKEVAELVKKILAEVRRSLFGSGAPNSLAEVVSASENPIPFELTKQLLGSSNSQLDSNKSLGVDLAALMTKLKQMDPQLLQGNDLLKRLNVLVAKSGIDTPVGALLGNIERPASRPVKASPLAELASKKAAEIVEKVKEAIAQATKSRDGSSLVLNLNPKDLGEVVVKVQQRDDQIFAKISPKAPEVQEVIRAKIDEIVKVLTAAGFKAENVHISVGSSFDLADNGARFAHHYKDGEHSGAPKWSRQAGKEEKAPDGATVSYKDGSKSNELAGWVA